MKRKSILKVIIVVICYLLIININLLRFKIEFLSSLDWNIQRPIVLILETLSCLVISFALVKSFKVSKSVFDILGLSKGIGKGLLLAFLFTLPMLIGFSIVGSFREMTFKLLLAVLYNSIMAGFIEELIFRAFPIGFFHRVLKIGFLPVILITSILFGLGHIGQGNGNLINILGVLAITFGGGLIFGWLFIEWDYNIWIPAGVHTFMNMYWTIFDMNITNNAAGNLWSNVFRGVSVVIIIGATLWKIKRDGSNLKGKWLVVKASDNL